MKTTDPDIDRLCVAVDNMLRLEPVLRQTVAATRDQAGEFRTFSEGMADLAESHRVLFERVRQHEDLVVKTLSVLIDKWQTAEALNVELANVINGLSSTVLGHLAAVRGQLERLNDADASEDWKIGTQPDED